MFKAVVIELVPLLLGDGGGTSRRIPTATEGGVGDDAAYPASLSIHHLSDPVKCLAKIDRSVPGV